MTIATRPKRRKKAKTPGCVRINLEGCKYDVLRRVTSSLQWTVVCDDQPYHLLWSDCSVTAERVMKLVTGQKINHFCGMLELCRKKNMARHMSQMAARLPKLYGFIPRTYQLPEDTVELQRDVKACKTGKTWIIKPDAGCQGRGIVLVQKCKQLDEALKELNNERAVAQHYISKPLLISGHKFDIRIYALVISCSPLSIFVYRDGIARFASIPHQTPATSNLRTACMHLTNHAINRRKTVPKGTEGPEVSLKWRLNTLFDHLDSIDPFRCFELLGYDFLIDSKGRPWLLEVNHSPSFHTDSDLDVEVKDALIADTLRLVRPEPAAARKFYKEQRSEALKRLKAPLKQPQGAPNKPQSTTHAPVRPQSSCAESKELAKESSRILEAANSGDYERHSGDKSEATASAHDDHALVQAAVAKRARFEANRANLGNFERAYPVEVETVNIIASPVKKSTSKRGNASKRSAGWDPSVDPESCAEASESATVNANATSPFQDNSQTSQTNSAATPSGEPDTAAKESEVAKQMAAYEKCFIAAQDLFDSHHSKRLRNLLDSMAARKVQAQEAAAAAEQRSRARQRKVSVCQSFISASAAESTIYDQGASSSCTPMARSEGPSHSFSSRLSGSQAVRSGRSCSQPAHLRAQGHAQHCGSGEASPPPHPHHPSLIHTTARGHRDSYNYQPTDYYRSMYREEPGEDDEVGFGRSAFIDARDYGARSAQEGALTGAQALAVHGTRTIHAPPVTSAGPSTWGEHTEGKLHRVEVEYGSPSQRVAHRAGAWAQKRMESLERKQVHGFTALTHHSVRHQRHRDSQDSTERNDPDGSGPANVQEEVLGRFIAKSLVPKGNQASSSSNTSATTPMNSFAPSSTNMSRTVSRTSKDWTGDGHNSTARGTQDQILYEVLSDQELKELDEHQGRRKKGASRHLKDDDLDHGEHSEGGTATVPSRGVCTPVKLAAEAAEVSIDDIEAAQRADNRPRQHHQLSDDPVGTQSNSLEGSEQQPIRAFSLEEGLALSYNVGHGKITRHPRRSHASGASAASSTAGAPLEPPRNLVSNTAAVEAAGSMDSSGSNRESVDPSTLDSKAAQNRLNQSTMQSSAEPRARQHHSWAPIKPSEVAARIAETVRAQSHRSRSQSHPPEPSSNLYAAHKGQQGRQETHQHADQVHGADRSDHTSKATANHSQQHVNDASQADVALDRVLKAGALRCTAAVETSSTHATNARDASIPAGSLPHAYVQHIQQAKQANAYTTYSMRRSTSDVHDLRASVKRDLAGYSGPHGSGGARQMRATHSVKGSCFMSPSSVNHHLATKSPEVHKPEVPKLPSVPHMERLKHNGGMSQILHNNSSATHHLGDLTILAAAEAQAQGSSVSSRSKLQRASLKHSMRGSGLAVQGVTLRTHKSGSRGSSRPPVVACLKPADSSNGRRTMR